MTGWVKHCCCPVLAEVLEPRALALTVAAAGAAQLGASCLGLGLPCAFHSMTGLPCPGCGLTRSVLALLHGRVGDSIYLHPFGIPLLLVLAGALVLGVMPPRPRAGVLGAVAAVERRTGVSAFGLMLMMILWGVRITGVLPLAAV